MLVELVVRDLVLFETAQVALGAGLNVVTGETGAGKSLLLGALECLQGDKPRTGMLREGAERATIEARFVVPARNRRGAPSQIERWLTTRMPGLCDAPPGDAALVERELILGRTLERGGRTRAYVNQRPVAREALAELAGLLLEIHGQNEHQRLLDPAEQLRILDEYGGLDAPVRAYREKRSQWRELSRRAQRLQREAAERAARLAELRADLAHIEGVNPRAGEHAELLEERELLRHAGGLKSSLTRAVDELLESDASVLERSTQIAREVGAWKERVGSLRAPWELLEAARENLAEGARELRSLADRLEVDPARLEVLEGRLDELERLEHKFGCSEAQMAALALEFQAEMQRIQTQDTELDGLAGELDALRQATMACAQVLGQKRAALEPALARQVQAALEDLGLPQARFALSIEDRSSAGAAESGDAFGERYGDRGCQRVEFLISTNPGQPLRPLRAVASGGEVARIMLALRTVMAKHAGERTLVFDEIDSNVGGRLGPVVARRLRSLSGLHQVLCVTHLPAIAAAADLHFKVTKKSGSASTRAQIAEIKGPARVAEIADMIAGGGDQATARAEAQRLLAAAQSEG